MEVRLPDDCPERFWVVELVILRFIGLDEFLVEFDHEDDEIRGERDDAVLNLCHREERSEVNRRGRVKFLFVKFLVADQCHCMCVKLER